MQRSELKHYCVWCGRFLKIAPSSKAPKYCDRGCYGAQIKANALRRERARDDNVFFGYVILTLFVILGLSVLIGKHL